MIFEPFLCSSENVTLTPARVSVTGLVERVEEIYVAKWHIKKSEKKSPLPNSLGDCVGGL